MCSILDQAIGSLINAENLTVFIRSLSELLKPANDNDNTAHYYFRGEAKTHADIKPSIYATDGLVEKEDTLFKECYRLSPYDFEEEHTTFEKLVKMQHYGLPTRLLDITSNPLVALFFATEERCDKKDTPLDGRVVILRVPNQRIKFSDSDTVSAVSNICKRPIRDLVITNFKQNKSENYEQYIERFNQNHTGYLVHEIRAEKPYFHPCIRKEDLERVWCVRPLMKNARIIKQDGLFLLFGISGDKKRCPLIMDWNKSYDEENISQAHIIKIEAKNKAGIRQQLRYLGVSEDKIYPDLEHITKHLKDNMNN